MTPPLLTQLHSMYSAMGFTDLPTVSDMPSCQADLEARCLLVALYDAITENLLDNEAHRAADAMSFVITPEALTDTRRHNMLCTFVHMLSDLVRNRARAAGVPMDAVDVDRQLMAPLGLLPSLRTPGSGRAFQQALDRLYVTACVSRMNRSLNIDMDALVFGVMEGARTLLQTP